jgi:hypothetical protein
MFGRRPLRRAPATDMGQRCALGSAIGNIPGQVVSIGTPDPGVRGLDQIELMLIIQAASCRQTPAR